MPGWTPAGVCILGWSRSRSAGVDSGRGLHFGLEQEPESTLRSMQEPIKNFKGPNFGNDACFQTEWN